jgi:hypothetical protein
MKRDTDSRLGFLSTTGAVAAGVALLLVIAWTLLAGPGMFSPGTLSAATKARSLGGVSSHSQLTSCEACHSAPWAGQSMADKCLACHANVAAEVSAGTGLHGRLLGKGAAPTCRGCHTEHHGANGPLTVTDNTFPHDRTGYSLRGHNGLEGTRVRCVDCHPKGLASFDPASCSACHTQRDAAFMAKHNAEFGTQCLLCHNGSGGNLGDFDHNKLPFKLTGKHADVPCAKCHSNTGSIAAFKSAPRDCYACHAKDDKHNGTFGQQCGGCHSTETWKNATFDHTVFPINHGNRGQNSTCQTCHPTDLKTYTCFGCHQHSAANVVNEHEGKPLSALTDCIQCHRGGRQGDN